MKTLPLILFLCMCAVVPVCAAPKRVTNEAAVSAKAGEARLTKDFTAMTNSADFAVFRDIDAEINKLNNVADIKAYLKKQMHVLAQDVSTQDPEKKNPKVEKPPKAPKP